MRPYSLAIRVEVSPAKSIPVDRSPEVLVSRSLATRSKTGTREFRLLLSFNEATGWKQMLSSCEEMGRYSFGRSVDALQWSRSGTGGVPFRGTPRG